MTLHDYFLVRKEPIEYVKPGAGRISIPKTNAEFSEDEITEAKVSELGGIIGAAIWLGSLVSLAFYLNSTSNKEQNIQPVNVDSSKLERVVEEDLR